MPEPNEGAVGKAKLVAGEVVVAGSAGSGAKKYWYTIQPTKIRMIKTMIQAQRDRFTGTIFISAMSIRLRETQAFWSLSWYEAFRQMFIKKVCPPGEGSELKLNKLAAN